MNMKLILEEAEAGMEAFALNFAQMYLAKSAGVAGAPPITGANIGRMAASLGANLVIAGVTGAIAAKNAAPVAPAPASA